MNEYRIWDDRKLCYQLEKSIGPDFSNKENIRSILSDVISAVHHKYDESCITEIPHAIDTGKYFNVSERESSFEQFPEDKKTPNVTPKSMAHAGFVYLGMADYVMCFHCGLVLRSFETDDIPMEEHKKFKPDCEYAKNSIFDQELQCYTLDLKKGYVGGMALKMFMGASRVAFQPDIGIPSDSYLSKSMYKDDENTEKGFGCSICIGERQVKTVFLPCMHEFCPDCIYGAFSASYSLKECFYCRREIEHWAPIKRLSERVVEEYSAINSHAGAKKLPIHGS